MESLESLSKQLGSLDELRTIVKTMKALSAASIRQYEQAVTALAGYYRNVERGLHVVLKDLPHPLTRAPGPRGTVNLAAVVFGSDHGLCGRFNEEITRHTLERLDANPTKAEQRLILAVGARAAASLERENQNVEKTLLLPGSAEQITATVQEILLTVEQWRSERNVHYLYVFYNRHSGKKAYRPVGIELLPINLHRFQRLEEKTWPSRSLPTFTMDREALLRSLLNQYLFVTIFRACAESQAGEHAARLTAMQSAERNLDERIGDVTMDYRHARQNVITSELLDVVAGFEAITND